jgi:acetate kinase
VNAPNIPLRLLNPDTVILTTNTTLLRHNAPALSIVRAVTSQLPNATNIAYFDSSFHSTIPPHISTYPISPKIATHNQLRKYGFHGLSYAFILRSVANYLHKPAAETNLIALHLGSGASACCIKEGKSFDTSMGLTPLAGLPGATRSGSIDPSLVFHYTHDAGKPSPLSSKEMHITTAEEILNKKSGWRALTGTTDFGAITTRAQRGEPESKLAFDIFVDRILGFVGGYYVRLGGEVDALVFAGGIGEKGAALRRAVVGQAKCLGFVLDEERNENVGEDVVEEISAKESRHRVLVCKTDEQLEMARGVVEDADRFTGDREGKS